MEPGTDFKPHHSREFGPDEPETARRLREGIVAALRTVFDPEIPVNVYDIGLIYDIDVKPDQSVDVKMTLTAPNCPAAGTLPGEVQAKTRQAPGVADARVEVVWEPQWNMTMLSEGARLQLGF